MRLVIRWVPAFCAALMMVACSKSEPAPETPAAARAEKKEAAQGEAPEAATRGEAPAEPEAPEAAARGEAPAEPESAAPNDAGKAIAQAAEQVDEKVKAAAEALEERVAEAEAMLADDSPALTREAYEALLLALAECKVDEGGIQRDCAAKKAFDEARRRNTRLQELAGMTASLGQKHIGHEAPAVRLQAAQMMSSFFGADAESQVVLIAAAQKEQDPLVLKSILNAVGSKVGANPEVRALLLKAADHEHEKVRMEALSWLTSTFASGTEGTLEKALDKIEGDPSAAVRQTTCERIGGRGDERVLPLLEKMTGADNPDDKLAAHCMRGLVKMWTGYPKPSQPSEKAYRLTLKRLADEPRSKERPAWTIMSDIRSIVADTPNSFHTEWESKASWVDKKKLAETLADLVADRKANWMARTGAIDTMVKIGVDKAVLEKLAQGYQDVEGTHGEDTHVLKRLKDALSKP